MVQVRDQSHLGPEGDIDLAQWLRSLPITHSEIETSRLLAACKMAQEALDVRGVDSGDWAVEANCFLAGLDIALILAELQVGTDCLLAGLLYRAVREQRVTTERVAEAFGEGVARLIEGVSRMAAIGELRGSSDRPVLGQAQGQKDNIRKMLIALVDDVRVALIKLAERTCAIRAVKNDDQRRLPVAREVFDVYAPLAHRLGIGQLK